jgi:hypothetical protein
MSTIHVAAPGATDVEQVLVHPVTRSVTVKVKCTMNPGAPQLPDEKVIVCTVFEPTIAQPAGLPSTVIFHEKENCDELSDVPMV